ncbi:MAG TPA: hypothetical protein VF590_27240, partial [Isosphaeraceae bacterium]
LADGQYEFFVEALRPDGLSTGVFGAGTAVIDTVAPAMSDAILWPRTGQIQVTFREDRSGLAQATLTSTSPYSLSRQMARRPRAFAITGVRALPPSGPSGLNPVILATTGGRQFPGGRYLFTVLAGGVSDVAGNSLGQLSSQFVVINRNATPAVPATGATTPQTTSTVNGGTSSAGTPPALRARRRRPIAHA